MAESRNKSEIDKIYAQLSPKANDIYKFVIYYIVNMNKHRDYDGSGMLMSMVEINLLSIIADIPGITVSKLAVKWGTTKGAISKL